MTDQELQAIEAREKAATKGPWEIKVQRPREWRQHSICFVCSSENHNSLMELYLQSDAEFVAHARADIPDLIAELKRYRELAKVVREIAVCEDWDMSDLHDGMPEEKRCVLKLLKEPHDDH